VEQDPKGMSHFGTVRVTAILFALVLASGQTAHAGLHLASECRSNLPPKELAACLKNERQELEEARKQDKIRELEERADEQAEERAAARYRRDMEAATDAIRARDPSSSYIVDRYNEDRKNPRRAGASQ
jgi:hypothetical protein